MADGGLSLLISIGAVLAIVGFAVVLAVIFTPQGNPDILSANCDQQLIGSLPSFNEYPCVFENGPTNKRFTAPSNRTVVASTSQVPYKQSCATICNSIDVNGNCVGSDTQITNYNSCIVDLKPDEDCNLLANPIGKVGSTAYYMEVYYAPGQDPPITTPCLGFS